MELREQIRQWASWPGWRRHAPAASSVVAHGVVGLAIVSLMAASVRLAPPPEATPPAEAITVELMADSLPMRPLPTPAPRAPRDKTAPLPAAPYSSTDQRKTAAPIPATAAEGPSGGSDSVYIPSPFATQRPTGGLNGLANIDPCAAKKGVRPKDCTNWAAKVGAMDSVMPRSKEDLATQHAAFMPKCPWNVGCDGGEWISTNGTRSVGRPAPGSRRDHGSATPMAAGAAGLGGLHESVGRLGFNPDHFDRGFGD